MGRLRKRIRKEPRPPGLARRLAVTLGCLLILTAPARAESPPPVAEYQVKAAFLYNFCKFVQWPPASGTGSDGVINICVLGENPFGDILESIRGKAVGDRTIQVHYLEDPGQVEDDCHLLFLRGDRPELERALKALAGRPILTVSDVDSFTAMGGMINLVIRDNRVRFEINPRKVAEGGIQVSSNLMKLAIITGD